MFASSCFPLFYLFFVLTFFWSLSHINNNNNNMFCSHIQCSNWFYETFSPNPRIYISSNIGSTSDPSIFLSPVQFLVQIMVHVLVEVQIRPLFHQLVRTLVQALFHFFLTIFLILASDLP